MTSTPYRPAEGIAPDAAQLHGHDEEHEAPSSSASYFGAALAMAVPVIPLLGGITLTIYVALLAVPVMLAIILVLCFAKEDV